MKHLTNFSKYTHTFNIPCDLPIRFKQLMEKIKTSPRETPLKKLLNSQITEDGKFLLMEGILINMKNGNQSPLNENLNLEFKPIELPFFGNNLHIINEEAEWKDSYFNPKNWTLSGILHGAADISSVAADFIVPGSGAFIDAANALSYLVEAEFADTEEEKETLYIMAVITFGFIFVPYIPASVVKAWIKSGAKVISKTIFGILKTIWVIFDALLLRIPTLLTKITGLSWVTKMLGKNAPMAGKAISNFLSKIKDIFKKFLEKRGIKLGGAISQKSARLSTSTEAKTAIKEAAKKGATRATKTFAKNLPLLKKPVEVLTNLGFKEGKVYKYITTIGGKKITQQALIKKISTRGVEVTLSRKGGRTVTRLIKPADFLEKTIVSPFERVVRFRGVLAPIPLFVKRFVDNILEDGNVDEESILKNDPLNPDQVERDFRLFADEIAKYEGESNYTINPSVKIVQTALGTLGDKYKNLLSDNGRINYPVDGKFGPLTRSAIIEYQKENNLEPTGEMDEDLVDSLIQKYKDKEEYKSLVTKLESLL